MTDYIKEIAMDFVGDKLVFRNQNGKDEAERDRPSGRQGSRGNGDEEESDKVDGDEEDDDDDDLEDEEDEESPEDDLDEEEALAVSNCKLYHHKNHNRFALV